MKKLFLLIAFIALAIVLSGCTSEVKCGDGVCHTLYENHENCPQDCEAKTVGCVGADCPGILPVECISGADCNDNNSATEDSCLGTPKKCSHALIASCKNNDDYCPAACTAANDSDCPVLLPDECNSNAECSDGDILTADSCTGTPKKCVHEQLKKCGETGGEICHGTQACPQGVVKALDTEYCCPVKCIEPTSCEGITCPENQRCLNGKCVLKTCTQLGGQPCNSREVCPGNLIVSYDSAKCCATVCAATTSCEGLVCPSNQKCASGNCVLKTCAEQSGITCETNKFCDGSDSGSPLIVLTKFHDSLEKTTSFRDYLQASNSSACCSTGSNYKCASGDVYFSTPATVELSDTKFYLKLVSHNSFAAGTEHKAVEQLEYSAIIDGWFSVSGIAENQSGGRAIAYGDSTARIFICDGCFDTLAGKSFSLTIDPDNRLKETNESNNSLEGTVPTQ
ncbi:MAG: hypothetical protein V1494_05845 [Candidatus Diapherotrites archaeon]